MDSIKGPSSFSFDRCWLVAVRFWKLNQKSWLTGLFVAAGLIFSFWLLFGFYLFDPSGPAVAVNMTAMIEGPAMFFYLIGGLALTSMIFSEVHTSTRAHQFLTLPASTLEKFAAAWFVTSLAFTVFTMLAILGLSLIVELITAVRLWAWSQFSLFNPFSGNHLESIGNYFFYHSIFFLGAVYFRKNNFLNTVLVIIVFFIGMFILIGIGGLIIAYFMTTDLSLEVHLSELGDNLPGVIQQIFRVVVMVLLLFFSYLQLKNKQIA